MAVRSKNGNGLAVGMAVSMAQQALDRLEKIEHLLSDVSDFIMTKRVYVMLASGNAAIGTTQFAFTEPIPAGYVFVGRRLIATAPEGSKLQIFRDTRATNNLVEVAANVQEYADGILGSLAVRGPVNLLAVISGAKAEGNVSIRLEGELVAIPHDRPVTRVR